MKRNFFLLARNCVWSDSDGLPPDIVQAAIGPHEIPESFDVLLSTLQEEVSLALSGGYYHDLGDNTGRHCKRSVSPTGQALATIVSKCILVSANRKQGLKLAKYLVTQHGSEKDTTLCILLLVLEEQKRTTFQPQIMSQFQTSGAENATKDRDLLSEYAWSVILDQIPSSFFLREELRGKYLAYSVVWIWST